MYGNGARAGAVQRLGAGGMASGVRPCRGEVQLCRLWVLRRKSPRTP